MNIPERDLEPLDEEVDGALVCCECEETIPGDTYYFEVDGKYYCEECMISSHRHIAPFKGEMF